MIKGEYGFGGTQSLEMRFEARKRSLPNAKVLSLLMM
jgi:hypothetical protein